MKNRVVITSYGFVSSIGKNEDEIIESFKTDRTNFKVSDFDKEIAICPINGFNFKDYTGKFKDSRYITRGAAFALASAFQAVKKSGLNKNELSKAGLFIGSGPNFDIDSEFNYSANNGIDWNKLQALWILKFLPNTGSSLIAKLLGIHGENLTIGTACSASLQAIGEAYRRIKDRYLDLAFAGGGDSRISKGGLLAYKKAHALMQTMGNPVKEYIPFKKDRNGFIPGEGGAFFLLESEKHANKRGVKILAEISGYSSSIDGYNMTAPEPTGKFAEYALKRALDEAGLSSDDINFISTHGTGTPLNDAMESVLIDRFYKKKPYMTAFKSWVGHLSAASGAIELALTILCMKKSFFPKIRLLDDPCNENLNFIYKNLEFSPENLIIENFGFGGQNAVLAIKKWKE